MRATFEALSVPTYRVLFLGTLYSFAGMQMQVIARAYLAYELTGSNAALGGVMIAFGIPQLLLSLYGGVIADRLAKRNVIVFWQTILAVSSGLLALAIFTGHIEYWMLLAGSVATGVAFSFIGPARQAFIGDIVPDHLMGNAIILQQANMNGTRVIGPALAGTLIAIPAIGTAGVYAVTTVGFIASTLSMLRLPPGLPRARTERVSALQDTLEGLRYVRQNKPIAILITMSFLVVAFSFPYQGFLASVTKSVFGRGAVGLGVLSSLAAVGALAATLTVASLTGHKRAWRFQVLAGLAFGAALAGFGAAPNFGVALLLIFIVGAMASAFQSLNNALTMTLADSRYYGRIHALMSLSWSLFGIISLPLGLVADAIGIRLTLVLMGACAIVSVIALEVLAGRMGVETELRHRRAQAAKQAQREAHRNEADSEPPAAEASPPAAPATPSARLRLP